MTDNQERLLELALKAGASHAEIYQARSHSRPVFFEGNRLKQLESSQAEGCALRIWKNGCPGLAVAYGKVEPEIIVAKAIALSQLNEPETIELAEARTEIYLNADENIAPEKFIEIGREAIEKIRDAYPEIICNAEFECEEETTVLKNSLGLHCEYTDTSVSYFLGVEWVRGEDFLGIYDGEYTRNELNTDKIIQQILQRLEWAKNNTTTPTGKIPVLLTANAITMLWSTIESALNGKRVLEKSSPWSDRLGELVMSEQITLSQQPTKEPYSCPFDDEGMLSQPLSLVTRGKLEQFYSDRTTGRKLGTGTTGNGFRSSLGNYPTPDLINLIVEPGKDSFSELINTLDNGLIVDQILGGGADISGDFSVNIDLGYRVQNGQIIGRVKDSMVSGNVYTALKQVVALGADIQWNGSCYTPSIIVEGLSVVG
jgi:PmbA protein